MVQLFCEVSLQKQLEAKPPLINSVTPHVFIIHLVPPIPTGEQPSTDATIWDGPGSIKVNTPEARLGRHMKQV